ncbi:MAG TPA: MFS transporter [Tepidisphaeraceae bacterium]|nr:MFS transporter [Tepidisphaeraceae bacterium]
MSQAAAAADMPPLARRTAPGVMPLLSVMMFIQFFIWGAWYVSMGPFMATHGMGSSIGRAYTLAPLAAIVSPFFLGMIADRFFASQRVLLVMHLLGAAAMFAIPYVTPATVPNVDPTKPAVMAPGESSFGFLALVFVHSLFYMPTINLTNSVSFAHLTNQEKQFPLVRVFGTLGWIAAGLLISALAFDVSAKQFHVAGAAAVGLALFSFVLPHTPPPAKGRKASVREVLGVDAFSLFRSRSFAVFALSSFLICIPLAAYYSFAAATVKTVMLVNDPANPNPPFTAWMQVGQGAEVVFMLIMPFFFRRLGVKWMLATAMLAWVARYALFAAGVTGPSFVLIMLGVALHGICYDFFFVTGFIYTDKRAAKQIAAQAQGLIVLLTYGLGLAIGGYVMGELYNNIVGDKVGRDALPLLQKFWIWPAALAAVVLVIFAALFRDDTKEPPIGPRSTADGSVARGEAASATAGAA